MSPVPQPLPGSTVVLSTTIATHMERIVFIKRSASSRFMPGAYVFPGGKMDDEDAKHANELLSGPNCPTFLNPFIGLSEDRALAFYLCAIRETAEETGILFVNRAGSGAGLTTEEWKKLRPALLSGPSFWNGMKEHGLLPDLSSLVPMSRWITPTIEPRRFDAVLFLASTPEGQTHDSWGESPNNTEVCELHVLAAPDAIAMHRGGTILLPPPTLATLECVAAAGGVNTLKMRATESKDLLPYCPHAVFTSDGKLLLTLPGHPNFEGPNAIPLPGRTFFSRIEGMRFQ